MRLREVRQGRAARGLDWRSQEVGRNKGGWTINEMMKERMIDGHEGRAGWRGSLHATNRIDVQLWLRIPVPLGS